MNNREYRQTSKYKELKRLNRQRDELKNWGKQQARRKLLGAIKGGVVVKPDRCERFSELCMGKLHGHHADYNKELEVNWLCEFHHREEHALLKKRNEKPIPPLYLEKPVSISNCIECDFKLTYVRLGRKFCSPECSGKYNRRKRKFIQNMA